MSVPELGDLLQQFISFVALGEDLLLKLQGGYLLLQALVLSLKPRLAAEQRG
jgi:hypothetical protein